jgi:hypothetical protein
LTATNTFTVVVSAIHNGPALGGQADQIVNEQTTLVVTNRAIDSDIPPRHLSYALLNAPSGAVIDTNGVITWTPDFGILPVTKTVSVLATDDGIPSLTATQSFRITVGEPDMSSVKSVQLSIFGTPTNAIAFSGIPNSTYVTQYATNLPGQWISLSTNVAGTNGLWSVFDPAVTDSSRFYRAFWLFGP